MSETVIGFRASFPPILTAFKRSGDGGGMRVQLDIPESDIADAVALQALTQERLWVEVRVLDEGNDEPESKQSNRKLHI